MPIVLEHDQLSMWWFDRDGSNEMQPAAALAVGWILLAGFSSKIRGSYRFSKLFCGVCIYIYTHTHTHTHTHMQGLLK
jgi:hypothetical protein